MRWLSRLCLLAIFVSPAFGIDFQVGLDTSQEVPSPTLGGATPSGSATVSVDTITGNVTVSGAFSGLTSNASASHLHGLAAPGANAGVLFGMSSTTSGTSGSFSGAGTLSAGDLTGLLTGQSYLNLHTANNAAGEIRGQVVDSDILVYNVGLDTMQEVPSPTVTGSPMGSARVVVDSSTGEVEISGAYSGLTSAVTGAHLHGAAGPGSTAGVVFGLTHSGGTSGSFSGTSTLSSGDLANLMSGLTYLNVHTGNNAAGEIRGQVVPEPSSAILALLSLGLGFGFYRKRR